MFGKMGRQAAKDYLFYPALSGRCFIRTFLANLVAAGFRNAWAYIVIVCGHFADGAEKFTPEAVQNETKPEWYLRQMLGTANLTATSHDAPETASEEKFRDTARQPKVFGAHDVGTTRRGLDTAITDRAALRMKQRRRGYASLRSAVVAALLRLFCG